MGLLKDLENRLEKLVDGIFAENFQTSVEPIEIANQLRKTMLDNKKLSIKSYYVPASYRVKLSPQDHAQISALGPKLIEEFQNYLLEEAEAQGVEPVSKINVDIAISETLKSGKYDVSVLDSDVNRQKETDALAFLEIEGQSNKIPLVKAISTLGRSKDNDIYLPYEKISRDHAKINLQDGGFTIDDLGSTNGVFVDNERITSAFVPYGKQILVADLIVSIRRNYA